MKQMKQMKQRKQMKLTHGMKSAITINAVNALIASSPTAKRREEIQSKLNAAIIEELFPSSLLKQIWALPDGCSYSFKLTGKEV